MLRTPDKQNATMAVRLALPLTDNDADYPALTLANHLLGQGGNSRLWKRMREKEGLSYDVGSGVAWSSHEAQLDVAGVGDLRAAEPRRRSRRRSARKSRGR